VTIQAQILDLLKELQQSEHMSVMYITHDLAVVAESVDRVYVMYLGRVMETTSTRRLFSNPLHPYTKKLMNAIPKPGQKVDRLEVIEGNVPTPLDPPRQCPFFGRCPSGMPGICDQAMPELVEREPGHFVRCYLYGEETEPEDEWSRI
jgi:peptide/nickel transport system ATP-binding protein